MSLLELDGITISYGGERDALHNVSLSLEQGERIVLVGESGSGKSTLLHAVMGLLPPSARVAGGCIRFQGKTALCETPAKPPFVRGKDVAMVFQNAEQFVDPILKIGAQFDEMLKVHGISSKKERLLLQRHMLERMRLRETERILRSYPFELSGGMMQRVAIAMAMCLKPALLLADEPTGALDVVTQAQVLQQMVELNREYRTALLLVAHDMGVADYVADKVGVMYQGELVEFGTREEMFCAPRHPYTEKLLKAARVWEI